MKRVYEDPSAIKLKGRYRAELRGGYDGPLLAVREDDNVVTTVGKEFIASFLKSAAAAAATFTCKYMAVGTDATAEVIGNTALGVELARTTGTASYTSGGIFNIVATFVSGSGTGAIVEYGLLSSSTAGTLISRNVQSVINKGANDVLTVSYALTFS